MFRSFRYRIRPTRAQERRLLAWLDATREVYNAALQERRDAWVKQKISVRRFAQNKQLPAVRAERPDLANVPIVVLRGSLERLEHAFECFFRRCKMGLKPGFPRFRSKRRWDSFVINDLAKRHPIVAGGKRLAIPILGKIKLGRMSRPPEGTPFRITVIHRGAGRWTVTLHCKDVPVKPLAPSSATVGIDVGILNFAATSDGELFANPRPSKAARLQLERAQRRISRQRKGSKRRRRAALLFRRHHEHAANVRRENHIKIARSLVARYGTIAIENLNIKGLASGRLAKSVRDAAWGGFIAWLRAKAEEAGRTVVEVDPRGTSQICSGCGVEVRKGLEIRIHDCPHCGLIIDRDVNAARNILGLGIGLRGAAPEVRDGVDP